MHSSESQLAGSSTPLLSICIPTLNRKEWLKKCLKSVSLYAGEKDVELCISDNCSDEKVNDIVTGMQSFGDGFCFVRQTERMPLDQHMHVATRLTKGKYVFYLGDDDLLISSLAPLLKHLAADNPDIVLLNGVIIDADGLYICDFCPNAPRIIRNGDSAYRHLTQYSAFGAVVVRRELLRDDYFLRFYGTSHAYGCFWPALQNQYHERGDVLASNFPGSMVALRAASKSYDHHYLDMMVNESMRWSRISESLLNSEASKAMIRQWRVDHRQRMLRFRQFITFKNKRVPLNELIKFYSSQGFKGRVLATVALLFPGCIVRAGAAVWRSRRLVTGYWLERRRYT
jgi:abequosyltransferase